jgi:hypothetical protein
VFIEASHEVVGYADIHDLIVPVGEEVDEVLVLSHH